MNKPIKLILAVLAALVSAVIMAFVLSWIEINHELSIYSFSFWFIIPVGAVGCGLVAASGYLLAARYLHLRPTSKMLVLPVITAVGTFIGTNYLTYRQLELQPGTKLSDFMGFGEYFKLIITESGYSVRSASVDRVGGFGYVLALLQIIGFAGGGVIVQRTLQNLSYCSYSSRFMKRTKNITVSFRATQEYTDLVGPAHDLIKEGKINEIEELYTERKALGKIKKANYRSTATFYRCGDCNLEHAVIAGQALEDKKWKPTGRSATSPSAERSGQPNPVIS